MRFAQWMSDHNFEWSRDSGHQPVRISVAESEEFPNPYQLATHLLRRFNTAIIIPRSFRPTEVFGRETPFSIRPDDGRSCSMKMQMLHSIADAADAVNASWLAD